jgi:hypothetical protein
LVWNGEKYILENNMLPESENALRKNIIIEELYKLETIPVPKNKKYVFKIIEFEKERSHFYGSELIKIIHPKETSIGIVNNKIVAYKNLILSSSILDTKKNDWTKKLSNLGNKTFFDGLKNDILNIKFDNIQSLKNPHLIFRASLRANYPRISKISKKLEKTFLSEEKWIDSFKKIAAVSLGTLAADKIMGVKSAFGAIVKSINIYIRSGGKDLVDIIHPREKISSGLVNLSEYIKEEKDQISLELKWTSSHNLSFFGLVDVNSLDSNIKQESIKLSNLRHSKDKNINKKDLEKKGVQLVPGEFIDLEFPAKREDIGSNQEISFVLNSKGYYTQL